MRFEVIAELPKFDTGQYEGCEFSMSGGDSILTIRFAELPPFEIKFSRTRWHQFTALPNCASELVADSYFRLVEIIDSPALSMFIAVDKAPRKAYRQLRHYRIFLDETGCHEVFAEFARAGARLTG